MSNNEPTAEEGRRIYTESEQFKRWIRDKQALVAILTETVQREEENTTYNWHISYQNACTLHDKLQTFWQGELLRGHSRQALRATLIAQEHMML